MRASIVRVSAEILIAVVLLLAAGSKVWFDDGPPRPASHAAERAEIEANDDLNNGSTEGAPQQTVVNGWTEIAYLKLISEQLDEQRRQETDDRPVFLLAMCLIGIAVLIGVRARRV